MTPRQLFEVLTRFLGLALIASAVGALIFAALGPLSGLVVGPVLLFGGALIAKHVFPQNL